MAMGRGREIFFAVLCAFIVQFFSINGHAETSSAPATKAFAPLSGGADSGSGTVLPNLFTGTMSYSIPIEVPTGRKGMDPGLALTYQSYNGNGWVGVGWDLDVGAIERSAKNGVNYTGDEGGYVLRMAGSAVDLIYDSTPEAGFFRAKIEGGFSRIKKLTASDGQPYWEVTDKSGIKYIYGQSAASRQDDPAGDVANPNYRIFKWCLDRVEDTNGNYMTLSYTKDQGQIYPDRIDYTGNSVTGAGTTNYVKFYLDSRTDAPDMYSTNFSVKTAYRLKSIGVYAGGNLQRAYKLTYNTSASTSRALLASVQQFGKDASMDATGDITNETSASKLPLVSLTYIDPNKTLGTPTLWLSDIGLIYNNDRPAEMLNGDFNGDGKLDLMYYAWIDGIPGWAVALSNGHGFDPRTLWLSYSGPGGNTYNPGYMFVGDFNGDGKSDYMYYTNDRTWYVATSNGVNGFNAPIPWLSDSRLIYNNNLPAAMFLGDFNGDGKLDLMYYAWFNGIPGIPGWAVALSNGHGFDPGTMWLDGTSGNTYNPGYMFARDFNGDGKSDYMYYTNDRTWYVATSNGVNGFNAPIPWLSDSRLIYNNNLPAAMFLGDFNGDGKLDLMYYAWFNH